MIGAIRFLATLALTLFLVAGLAAGARAAHAAPKPTVAVLYFDYSGKDDQLGLLRKGLAQMMISDLSAVDAIQLVERDRLEEILAELKLGQSNKIDPASAAKVGKLLGARYLILGGYFDLKNMLRVDARVVEVETGKVVQSVGATGDADNFLALEQKLVTDIGTILGKQLSLPPAKTPPTPKVKPPAKLARRTALTYSRALHDIDSGDKARAKAELEQVVKEQPDFKLAMVDLDKLLQ
jgi:TolB-like protein